MIIHTAPYSNSFFQQTQQNSLEQHLRTRLENAMDNSDSAVAAIVAELVKHNVTQIKLRRHHSHENLRNTQNYCQSFGIQLIAA